MVAGSFGLLGGLSSVAGWIFGVPRLIDWDLDGITIKFNASIAIISLSVGLLLNSLFPQFKFAVRVCSIFCIALGAATIFQHLTQIDLGIDNFIIPEAAGARATAAPGRMGLPASSTFVLLGTAMLLLTMARRRDVSAMLAHITLVITLLSLIGYFFGASELYTIRGLTGIALQTATMLFALSIGTLALVREHGIVEVMLRNDSGGAMIRRLILPVGGVVLILGYLRVQAQHLGYVDTAFGTAMTTVIQMILFFGLLWWTAAGLSRSESVARGAELAKAENEMHRRIATAQEAERRRIARDVHDHIGQQLTGLRLRLESICGRKALSGELRGPLEDLRVQAARLDSDLSLLVWQMRPSILDTHGLSSAIKSFIREWSGNYGIGTEFHAPETEERLAPEIETNLYRIIQEALNNILKHAKATRVSITINYVADDAVVVIEDDGVGFERDGAEIHATESSGFGLVGMRERAALVGGYLQIESSSGTGTTIFIRVPRSGRTGDEAKAAAA
jgi:signal transduction histidine kinase